MQATMEVIQDYACKVGENPIWHSSEKAIYWLDIPAGRIFRYTPETRQSEVIYEGDVVGGMTIQADGSLLLFMEAGRVGVLKNSQMTTLIERQESEIDHRFNDVIATPQGSVFCGTLPYKEGGKGKLYHLKPDCSVEAIVEGVGIANGMGYSPDLTQFYFTDSAPARKIYRFMCDQDRLYDQQVFVDVPEEHGFPDGMTVDNDGFIWSACWDGNRIIRYSPSGSIDMELMVPGAKQVSSICFGGDDYSDMYVTTAGGDDKSANGQNAGALFRVRLPGIHGREEFRSNIVIP